MAETRSTADAEEPPSPGPAARAVAVAVTVALVAVSGLVLDHEVGSKSFASGAPSAGPSGALFCPHGGQSGWRGWIVVANPGPRRVKVRLTELGKDGAGTVTTFGLGPFRQAYRLVAADEPAAATEVEYFGGWVGAAAILESATPRGLAAERCEQSSHRTWFVTDVPTASGQSAYVVVMNPFDEAAEFDVVFRTEARQVAPGSLTPFVLAPRHAVGIPVGEFVLQGQGEESLTARVVQRMGRVVAGGLAVSPNGIRAEAGVPAPATRWTLPAGGDLGTRQLLVENDGGSRVDLSVVAQGASSQRLVSGPEGLSVGPGEVKSFPVDGAKDAGMVIQASNGQAMISSLRLLGPRGDSACLDGSLVESNRWLALPALPPSGGRSMLLVENPGRTRVTLHFRLLGGGGRSRESIASRSIAPGRTIRIVLPSEGGRPVSVMITATGGTIVAAVASYSPDRAGYAATLALPMQ